METRQRHGKLGHASLILVGIGLSAIFWFLEALVHVLVFDDETLVDAIFAPQSHEIWMRMTVAAMFMAFAFHSNRMLEARSRAEEAATRANAEVTQIFETAADGMRVVDRDFTVLRANETFAALVGLPKRDIIGRKCYEVFRGHLCDTAGCPLIRVLNQEERIEYDAEKLRPDGARVPCIVTATPYRRPNGEIIGIVEDFKDISERRRTERELMESRARLRELTSHLQVVREEERSRIAREIHDELGQALTALNMDLHWLKRRLPLNEPALAEKVEAMMGLVGGTVGSVRRICSELRPGILDDYGLVAAIEWQAGEFSKRTGISCGITAEPGEIKLDQDLSIAVFRIFQEALTNVIRHAEATAVEVRLTETEGKLAMRVCDNGKGLELQLGATDKSFGLIGIRERARDFGGELRLGVGPSGGTCVEVRIPAGPREETRD